MPNVDAFLECLKRQGPVSGSEIQKALKISQSSVSRLVRRAGLRVCRIGRSSSTRYALAREIARLGQQVPIFRVDERGQPSRYGMLYLLAGEKCWLERESGAGELFHGLPTFVEDMRPQGYMGSSFPARHPDLKLPARIRDWRDEHRLIALALRGEDCVGSLILGEESLDRFLAWQPRPYVRADYPSFARNALADPVGSSAGGEHPKFAVYSEAGHLLVKFAGGDGAAANRWRDLLVCEHIALETLREAGFDAVTSSWFDREGIRFLETQRFDRVGKRGRRGVLSLHAINRYYLGDSVDSWSRASGRLVAEPTLSIDTQNAERMIWLDTFGQLIGNTDRHFGNLCFFTEEAKALVLTLTPVYDMLPMVFAPVGANVIETALAPAPPNALNLHVWHEAAQHASRYWERLRDEPCLSEDFRRIAAASGGILAEAIAKQTCG